MSPRVLPADWPLPFLVQVLVPDDNVAGHAHRAEVVHPEAELA